jgi:hypothetical protein
VNIIENSPFKNYKTIKEKGMGISGSHSPLSKSPEV